MLVLQTVPLSLLALYPLAGAASGLVAYTHQGALQGTHLNDKVSAFLGVPYAQPPVGKLRFEPPVPIAPAKENCSEPFDATQFGNVCHQYRYREVLLSNLAPTTPESEDCLNLNVFVPRERKESELLPTLLWMHGGGFNEGGGSLLAYNPTGLVHSQPNMIVVTLNYRLNLFGYPNSPAIPMDAQNPGLRDQRAALEWLQQNLPAFGGDPNKITLGGQSAGADAAAVMAYAYRHDPIARALLLESGQPVAIGELDATTFYRVAKVVGCRDTSNSKKEFNCMKKVPISQLTHAISNKTLHTLGASLASGPMVDNRTHFSVEEYMKRGEAGEFARLPMFIGANAQEGDGAVNWSRKCGVNVTTSNRFTRSFFNCPIAQEATYRSKRSVPVWRYHYMAVFPSVSFFPWVRSYHTAEIPIVLGSYRNLRPHKPAEDYEVAASKIIQNAFATFVRNPRHGLTKELGWPTFDPKKRTIVGFFRNNKPAVELQNPDTYDAICAHPPEVSFQEVAQKPTC